MNRFVRLLAVSTLCLVTLASARSASAVTSSSEGGNFGLGVILGDPSAITGKYFLDQKTAIDGGIAFNFGRWLLVYGDWLYHFNGAFGSRNEVVSRITPYIGVGGVLALSTRSDLDRRNDYYYSDSSDGRLALGLRIPLGLEWRPATIPLGVFLEIAPGVTVIPATHSFVEGGVGARFYF